MKLNPEKCEFFKKIEKVKNWPEPKKVKEIQQFLGLCGYYRKFVKDFAKIAAPMINLVKRETKWSWDQEVKNSFEKLKEALISYPILQQPDFNREFILYTDASGLAVGAILSQKDDEGNEYVCHYASRTLKGPECHYGISEKECLAVLWAVKLFRVYLYGKRFSIITDHSALKWLMTIKDVSGKLARWSIFLQNL